MLVLLVIGTTALATSVLSAVAGLGGGVVLLAVLAQLYVPTVAIPLQGAIQLAANGSRAAFLRHDVDTRVVAWSSLALLPASFLGVAIATSIPEDALRVALGVFVLVLAWRPHTLQWRRSTTVPTPALVGVGAASGLLNTTVGASGPVTSPFFKACTATHVAFVATAAVSQVLAHAAKLVAFAADGFDLGDHLPVVGVGVVGVVVGSRIGTRLLGVISPQHLDVVFATVLTALAVRLIATAVW